MGFWFSHKLTRHVGVSNDNVARAAMKERTLLSFNKKYPALDTSGADLARLLASESLATREWVSAALRSNTGHDKMLAAAYLINLRPLQSLRFLDNLISLVNPAKRRICVRAMDIISQLFQRSLLPRDRVLHPFSSRPTDLTGISNDSATVEEALCLWYFEEEIKFKYTKFIKSLERLLLSNTVDAFKRRALSILTQLLIKIPEGRPLALAIIINKLGDGNKAFASAVIHKLRLIVGKKPQLTGDVVEEIRSFLFRPNLLERAKYYAVVLLSCLELKNRCSSEGGKNSAEIAVALIKVYAAFFHAAVKASEIPERLTLALLAGLGRATPFVPEDQLESLLTEVDDLFRLVHTSNFTVSIQALMVLFRLTTHHLAIRDRYYQALYRKLRDPGLLQTSRGPTVLHLLYQSMLSDTSSERGAAFAQRLLQICLIHPQPGFVVGSLLLLSKLLPSKPQLIVTSQIPVCPKTDPSTLMDDEDEVFLDASDTEDTNQVQSSEHDTKPPSSTATQVLASWDHRKLISRNGSSSKLMQLVRTGSFYNPDAREPLFARAGGEPIWPLVLLTFHAHPTVTLFAQSLLTGQPVKYTGNPFDDFTLLHFLDRFAFKKPKKCKTSKRNAPPGRVLQRKHGVASGFQALPVNSAVFRHLSLEHIGPDEKFFHQYFNFVDSSGDQSEQRQPEPDTDESISDTEFDDYLEKYEKGLVPTGDGLEDDDDVDMDTVDFSDASNNDEANTTDEEAFSAMDGFQSDKSSKRKLRRVKHSLATDLHDSLDEDLDSDDDVSPKRKNSRPSTSNLFASAEELGRMYYASQDVPKRPFHRRTGGKQARANKGPKHRRPPSSKRQRWNAGQNTSHVTKRPLADRCGKKERTGCK